VAWRQKDAKRQARAGCRIQSFQIPAIVYTKLFDAYDLDHMTAVTHEASPKLPAELAALLPPDLRRASMWVQHQQGDVLFLQGIKPVQMFYVAIGEIVMQRPNVQGDLLVLQRVRQGFVAEASLQVGHYHCEAVATCAGSHIALPIVLVRQALMTDAAFAMRWIATLNQEMRRLRNQCERMSLKSVQARLLHLIETEGSGGCLPLKSHLKSLASELGVSHEALYRTLAAMETAGLLRRTDTQLSLVGP
jgi:CRP-like cAMP-binding protein